MRQYGEVPPWNAADNTPKVSAVTGLGTGGGAGVQTADSGGFGDVVVNVGANYNAAGSVVLLFAALPPNLFIAGDEAFGPLTQATDTDLDTVTISWTAAKFPVGGLKNYRIHYEWSISR